MFYVYTHWMYISYVWFNFSFFICLHKRLHNFRVILVLDMLLIVLALPTCTNFTCTNTDVYGDTGMKNYLKCQLSVCVSYLDPFIRIYEISWSEDRLPVFLTCISYRLFTCVYLYTYTKYISGFVLLLTLESKGTVTAFKWHSILKWIKHEIGLYIKRLYSHMIR